MFLYGAPGEYQKQKVTAVKHFRRQKLTGVVSTHRLEGAKYLATVWQMSSGVMISYSEKRLLIEFTSPVSCR